MCKFPPSCKSPFSVSKVSVAHSHIVYAGHEETSEEATPQDMYPPTSAADTEPSRIGEEGEEGEEREVDIGVVFRSEVAKAHDFMAKCEEALRQV